MNFPDFMKKSAFSLFHVEQIAFPLGGIKFERCLRQIQRGFYAAAVEKIEDQRKPEDFFGHRKGVTIGFAVVL